MAASTKQIICFCVAVVLYTMLTSIKNSIWFPYCRTLISCANKTIYNTTNVSNTAPSSSSSSIVWSGSAYCNDLDYVAKTAQVVKSWCDTLNICFQGIFMPILGRCSDINGRRTFLIVGASGLLIQILLCVLSSSVSTIGNGILSTSLLLLSSAIQGSTSTFIPTSVALIVDLKRSNEKEVGRAIGFLQGIKTFGGLIGAAFGILIISWNLSDYYSTFVSLVVPGLLMTLLTVFSPETHSNDHLHIEIDNAPLDDGGDDNYENGSIQNMRSDNLNGGGSIGNGSDSGATTITTRNNGTKSACKSLNDLLSPFYLIMKTRALTTIAIFSFLFSLGASSLSIISAFTITVFHWTQMEASLIIVYPAIVGVISFLSSAWIVPKCGSLLSVVISSVLGTIGLICMTLSAALLPLFFIIGLGFLASGAFGLVGYLSFISARIDPSKQGELQGTLGACALAGFALGNVGYSGLFYFLEDHKWIVFLIGTIFSFCSLILIGHYYVIIYDSSDFSILNNNDDNDGNGNGIHGESVIGSANSRMRSNVQMSVMKEND
jgi:MFS family permease